MNRFWMACGAALLAACGGGGSDDPVTEKFTQSLQFSGNVANVDGPLPGGMAGVATVTPPSPKTTAPGGMVTFDVAWTGTTGTVSGVNVGFNGSRYFSSPASGEAGLPGTATFSATVQASACAGVTGPQTFPYLIQVEVGPKGDPKLTQSVPLSGNLTLNCPRDGEVMANPDAGATAPDAGKP